MQTNKEKNTKYIYCVKNIYHNNVMVQNYILTKFESCCHIFATSLQNVIYRMKIHTGRFQHSYTPTSTHIF